MDTNTQSPNAVINAFAESVKDLLQPNHSLYVSASTFDVFSGLSGGDVLQVKSVNEIAADQRFDVVWGNLPLGVHPTVIENAPLGKKLKVPGNWALVFQSLQLLSDNGIGFFLVEPHGFSTTQGRQFQALINSSGFFVNAIFDAPRNLLQPETTLTTVFVAISRTENDKIFVGELSTLEQSAQVAKNFIESKDTSTIEYGTFIEQGVFNGFDQLRALFQIERLETQYHLFEKRFLKDVADEINAVRSNEKHTPKPNSVYIPKIGNSRVIADLEDATIKHHNYFQVVLNNQAASNYVASFFQSAIGQLVLKSLSTSSFIRHINKREINNAVIALPKITQQNDIVDTHHRLKKLKKAIDQIDQDISLNPTGTKHIQQQLDSMLESINALSDADQIRGIVREGESKRREFKETFCLDIRKKTKEKYIETSSLKTIVAFLNSEGGTLLVGVADDGNMPGVNVEISKFFKNNLDDFFKHIKNRLKTRIGKEFYTYFDYRIVDVDDKQVLRFDCSQSDAPCYLDGTDFYVRTNPATDKLEGHKLVEYVRHHFHK